eukprot:gene34147-45784_t
MGAFIGVMGMSTVDIAASGLNATSARVEAGASNIVNAFASRGAAPSFLLRSTPNGATGPYQPIETHRSAAPGGGVTTLSAVRLPSSYPLDVKTPPSMNATGTAVAPDSDPSRKVVEQVDAAQAYKLNLSLMRTAQAMEALLLDQRDRRDDAPDHDRQPTGDDDLAAWRQGVLASSQRHGAFERQGLHVRLLSGNDDYCRHARIVFANHKPSRTQPSNAGLVQKRDTCRAHAAWIEATSRRVPGDGIQGKAVRWRKPAKPLLPPQLRGASGRDPGRRALSPALRRRSRREAGDRGLGQSNGKVALVTGVTGQDGAYLSELLLAKGYTVHGIKRRSSSFNTERIEHLYQDPHEPDQRFILHYGDMTDATNLIRIVQQTQPDEIYNLAAQSHVQVSFETAEYTANADAIGPLRLLEAIRLLGLTQKTRFYQASTSELYGKVQE